MTESGTCGICGEPVTPQQQTEVDMDTGDLVHADCYARKEAGVGAEAEES